MNVLKDTNRKQPKNTGHYYKQLIISVLKGTAVTLFTMLFLFTLLYLLIFQPVEVLALIIIICTVVGWYLITMYFVQRDKERNDQNELK